MVEVVSAADVYDIGDRIEIVVDFTDRFNEPADPSTVTIIVKKPDATKDTETWPGAASPIIREQLGTFYLPYDATTAGRYDCRAEGEGALIAAVEGSFRVRRSRVL